MTLEEIKKQIEAAQAEVNALCLGNQWRMCIPYREDDSDALIGGALRKAAKLVKVAEAIRRMPVVAVAHDDACGCWTCELCKAFAELEADEE